VGSARIYSARIYYDDEEAAQVVRIKLIGMKSREKVLVDGKEIDLDDADDVEDETEAGG